MKSSIIQSLASRLTPDAVQSFLVLRTLRHYRRAQSQGHYTIHRLEERGGHKAKDITPSITWRREAGTRPRTSHHPSPGGERRAQSHGHHTIHRLEERSGHKATDITPSIAWRREAGTKPRTSHHPSPGGERRAHRQGHHTTDHLEERGGEMGNGRRSSLNS